MPANQPVSPPITVGCEQERWEAPPRKRGPVPARRAIARAQRRTPICACLPPLGPDGSSPTGRHVPGFNAGAMVELSRIARIPTRRNEDPPGREVRGPGVHRERGANTPAARRGSPPSASHRLDLRSPAEARSWLPAEITGKIGLGHGAREPLATASGEMGRRAGRRKRGRPLVQRAVARRHGSQRAGGPAAVKEGPWKERFENVGLRVHGRERLRAAFPLVRDPVRDGPRAVSRESERAVGPGPRATLSVTDGIGSRYSLRLAATSLVRGTPEGRQRGNPARPSDRDRQARTSTGRSPRHFNSGRGEGACSCALPRRQRPISRSGSTMP